MFNHLKVISAIGVAMGLWLLAAVRSEATDSTYVRFNTTKGNIDVQLFSDEAPKNVANFMSYVNSGAYNNTFIHRAIPGFIIQGGGFLWNAGSLYQVTAGTAVKGEHSILNTRGTIAMALQEVDNSASGTPGDSQDTGTTNWFFNLVDNSSLDTAQTYTDSSNGKPATSGPFTVFGQVANASSLAVMDAISNVETFPFNSPFDTLPLLNYTMAQFDSDTAATPEIEPPLADFIYVNSITTLTTTDLTTWQKTYFSGQPATVSAPSATPQNDSTPNLLKYVCDVNPTLPMSATERAKLPTVTMTVVAGTPMMTLTYRQRANLVGVYVNVVTSTDLVNWAAPTNATMTQTPTTDNTGDMIMQVQIPAPATGAQFIELQMTQS